MDDLTAMEKVYGNRMYYSGWTAERVPQKHRDGAIRYYEHLKAAENA